MLTKIPMNRLVATLIITNIATYICAMRLERQVKIERMRWHQAVEMMDYMVDVMERNNVYMTEFDLIALQNLGEGE